MKSGQISASGGLFLPQIDPSTWVQGGLGEKYTAEFRPNSFLVPGTTFCLQLDQTSILSIQELLLGPDASGEGLLFGKLLSFGKCMLQKLDGPLKNHESLKGKKTPWVQYGLYVCV